MKYKIDYKKLNKINSNEIQITNNNNNSKQLINKLNLEIKDLEFKNKELLSKDTNNNGIIDKLNEKNTQLEMQNLNKHE